MRVVVALVFRIVFSPVRAGAVTYVLKDLGTLGGTTSFGQGINASGQVAGASTPAHCPASHAALHAGGVWTDLGTFGGSNSEAWGINATGQATGIARTPGDAGYHAFLFSGGILHDIGTLGGTQSFPCQKRCINDAGQVAGYANVPGNAGAHAFLYSGGVMTDLGTLGGVGSYASALNSKGQVVGLAQLPASASAHAFLYSGGVLRDLGTLGGTNSGAAGINDSGQVVGDSLLAGDAATHAYFFSGGVMTDLGTLGGSYSTALAVNNAGQVIGDSFVAGDGAYHAFLYNAGIMTDLGTLAGTTSSRAIAINASGRVTGYAYSGGFGGAPFTGLHGFVYDGGVMQDLGTLGGSRSFPLGINDAGEVAGWSDTPGDVASHAIVATPCGDGVVNSREECDDGNAAGGDGCSASCTVEPGWMCTGSPSVCATAAITTTTSTSTTTTTLAGTPITVAFRSIGIEDGAVVESAPGSGVGGTVVWNAPTMQVGDQANNAQSKIVVSFDTSSILCGATIVSATLRLNRQATVGSNPFTTLGPLLADVQQGLFGGANLEPTDFEAPAIAPAAASMSNPATNGAWSTGALNQAGLFAINPVGHTQVRFAFAAHDNGNGVADRMSFATGDNANSSLWPELDVAYFPASTTSTTTTSSTTATTTSSTTSTSSTTTTVPGAPVTVTFRSIGAEDGTLSESSPGSGVGGAALSTSPNMQVGDQTTNAQSRVLASFDTSSLPAGATIVSATLRLNRVGLTGANPFTTLGGLLADVQSGSFGGNPTLQPSDFQAAATAPAAASMSNPTTNGAWSTGALSAAGLAAINPTGRTQARFAFEVHDNANGVGDRIVFASSDFSDDMTFWPALDVTYIPPSAGTTTTSTVPTTSSTASTATTTSSTSSTTTTLGGTPVTVTFRSIAVEDGTLSESAPGSGVGGAVISSATNMQVGDQATNAQSRILASFDTSSLPAGATIVSATLRLNRVGLAGSNPFTTLAPLLADVQTGSFGGDPTLQATDFQAAATAPGAASISNPATNGAWATGALDATGLSAINPTGRTQVRFAFAVHDNGNGVGDRISFATGDAADSTLRPALDVTYVP